jgi:cell fate (sporulation/competence/biofilm development) regulator YlbF (YheA/YmcA/DUF963 family)
MKKLFLLFLAFSLLLFSPVSVGAQEATETPAPILQKESFDSELNQLNEIYRGQLTEYRTAEKEFAIARDQYLQLQTLASINEVIETAKKVLGLRNQVLITYLDLLRVNLIAAEGVEIAAKQLVLERIVAQKNWLQSHQSALAATTDREQLNQLSDNFIAQATELMSVSRQAISLLGLGKLQNVFDRLKTLSEDITAQESTQSGVNAQRAVRETERLNQSLAVLLVNNWQELNEDLQENNASSFYSNLSKALNPIYADLSKLISFLEERLRQL